MKQFAAGNKGCTNMREVHTKSGHLSRIYILQFTHMLST